MAGLAVAPQLRAHTWGGWCNRVWKKSSRQWKRVSFSSPRQALLILFWLYVGLLIDHKLELINVHKSFIHFSRYLDGDNDRNKLQVEFNGKIIGKNLVQLWLYRYKLSTPLTTLIKALSIQMVSSSDARILVKVVHGKNKLKIIKYF